MSRYTPYKPTERIVGRAVALWMTMLSSPKYDNLGENSPESPDSIASNKFSSFLAGALPKNNTSEVIQRFGVELHKILMAPFTWEYEQNGEKKSITHQTVSYLGVDYAPDAALRVAAERAGLKMEFPWKTNMHLGNEYVSLGYGYGSPTVFHYPLSGDRWLATTLYGEDIKHIIALVESGDLDLSLNLIKR